MPRFDAALNEAKSAIVEIMNSVRLIVTRKNIRMHADKTLRIEEPDPEIKSIIDEFLTAENDPNSVYRGLYIQLGSIFELFIRKCIEGIVVGYEIGSEHYEDLPESIKKSNFYYSGRALTSIHEPVSGRNINFDEISRRLGTCVAGNRDFSLNITCFTLYIGNCTSHKVGEIMKSVNIKGQFWTDIGKYSIIQKYFNSTKAKQTEKDIKLFLDGYIHIRNRIVHSGEGSKSITENEILDGSKFFLALCDSISNHLKKVAN